MVGTLVLPEGENRRPGILVCHEGPGLDDHARGMAVALAELGYVAFALDYHGGGKPLSDRNEMMGRIGEFHADPLRTRAVARPASTSSAPSPAPNRRVAAMGYCFGGTMSFELARGRGRPQGGSGFHAGLGTVRPEDAAIRSRARCWP